MKSRRLANFTYSDDIEISSSIYDTYYSVKCLRLLKKLDNYKNSIINFIVMNEENYNDFSAYEKLQFLNLKFYLEINSSNDINRIQDIVVEASNSNIKKNYTLISFMIEVVNNYNIKLSDEFKVEILNSISSEDSKNTFDSIEEEILSNVLNYKLLSLIDSEGSKKYKQLVEELYIENYSSYVIPNEIGMVLVENGCTISDSEILDELLVIMEEKIRNGIETDKLVYDHGNNQGFEYLYNVLFFIKSQY